MSNDIIDLVLFLARQQNQKEYREDEVIRIITTHNEQITISDTTLTTLNPHPVKYDEAHAIYDLCTYV